MNTLNDKQLMNKVAHGDEVTHEVNCGGSDLRLAIKEAHEQNRILYVTNGAFTAPCNVLQIRVVDRDKCYVTFKAI